MYIHIYAHMLKMMKNDFVFQKQNNNNNNKTLHINLKLHIKNIM